MYFFFSVEKLTYKGFEAIIKEIMLLNWVITYTFIDIQITI